MTFRERLSKLYTSAYVLQKLIKIELSEKRHIPLSTAFAMWRKGFFSKSYILYNLKENNLHDYLSDIQENILSKWIIRDKQYMDNKLIFPKLIIPFALVPEDVGIVVRGKLCSISPDQRHLNLDELHKILQQEKCLILKPIDGASGDGIIRVEMMDNLIIWNKQKLTHSEFGERIQKLNNYLISKFIIQAEYSSNIFPHTVNTIRILTMIHPDDGKAFIAAAAHRIGTEKSFPVDNCAAGGLTAYINIKSGTVGKAVSTKNTDKLNWFTHHPDTLAPIEGITIPGWEKLCSDILDMANNFSFIPYIGWDVVITSKGMVIIEGNDGPDIKLHQVHQPLLSNPDIKRFYQFHQVI